MPMTIIAMTLPIAPIALPRAWVSRPTEPSSWLPRFPGPWGMSPSEPANSNSRLNWAVTTRRNASNWAAMVVPANQKTQPMNPKPSRITSSSRQPRPTGNRRPSSRTPPSRNTAKMAPPMISSSGWASTMIPTMSSAIPNQTAAFAISRRTRGSRNSAGPGRSMWGSVVGGSWTISYPAATSRRGPGGRIRTSSRGSTIRSSRRARR